MMIQEPNAVAIDSKLHSRKFEILTAFIMCAAMAALIGVVKKYSNAPVEALPEYNFAPITVFPDFASIGSIDVKKQQFFNYLQGYIESENERIISLRVQLLGFATIVDSGVSLTRRERERLMQIALQYELNIDQSNDQRIINVLLQRVDVIPTSLVLAQAANESAWGTSRFALEGNNLFGQWCYVEGCGIVPERRIRGATHEVKRFDSIADAIEAYFLNINSHHLYKDFRDMRARMRRQQRDLDPMELAYGLGHYSERGDHYVDEVQAIIEKNSLQERDAQLSITLLDQSIVLNTNNSD